MIVIVFGLPGSGKSYFASALASRLRAAYLNTDKLRKQVLNQVAYTGRNKEKVYLELLDRVKDHLRNHRQVIVDGTFYKRDLREQFREMAVAYASPLYFIEVVAREEVIRKRLVKPRAWSDADYQVYLLVKEEFEAMTTPHLLLSSEEDLQLMVEKALSYLNGRP